MADLDHEAITVRAGSRSGLPVIVAVHSTTLGQAVGGCRLWRYAGWRDGLDDALRLSAGMTLKCAVAGLSNGGGKTVVAVPRGAALGAAERAAALHDAGDVIESLGGRYAAGPDVGTGPADMAVIRQRTRHVFCTPADQGGSGDSSPHTAAGVIAALRAVCTRVHGSPDLGRRKLAIIGLGSVGEHLARQLSAFGASLVVSDIHPAKQALAKELGADWVQPEDALTVQADVLIPSALGGVITREIAPRLRCAAIAGPANNQLAEPEVAGLLHRYGIVWAPDYVVSAGGVIYALAVELHKQDPQAAAAGVASIADTVGQLLETAAQTGADPATAALELAQRRLGAAAGPPARAGSEP
jgi:glutamate dehydrogenase/leucine dehydrogenase